jgi:hypothetical protein
MTENIDFKAFDLEQLRRSLDLYMDKNGRFFYEGQEVEHDRVKKLFHQSIIFDHQTKEAYLKLGQQIAYFKFEVTPFLVMKIEKNPQSMRYDFVLNTEEKINIDEILGFYHQSLTSIYIKLKDQRPCMLSRHAQQQLIPELLQIEDSFVFQWANQRFFIQNINSTAILFE